MNITKTTDNHIHILKGGVILRLTADEAYELLEELYQNRDELYQASQMQAHHHQLRMEMAGMACPLPEQRGHISYQQAIQRHLCPYCSLQGSLDPEAPDDPDFQGYVCGRGHRFYCEKETSN